MKSAGPTLIRPPEQASEPFARIPRWLRAAFSVSLEKKVLGANLIIFAVAVGLLLSPLSGGDVRWTDMSVLVGALTIATVASYGLIKLALKPVNTLEAIARKVSNGRMSERVPPSLIADPDLAHLAATMNDMLENLAAGRRRMSKLAADVVYAQERERAQVARDLHDSVGQTLAAANFQIAAAGNQESVAEIRARLGSVRELLRTSLEEIRSVSRSLHPRVADDLGLPLSLQGLADLTRQRSLIDVRIEANLNGVVIPPGISATLYRVAQEALRNVELHADAGNALVSLSARAGIIELEVRDDGSGFDEGSASVRKNTVMARMRDRLSLAGGELHIHGTPECGTRVIARAKLETEDEAA